MVNRAQMPPVKSETLAMIERLIGAVLRRSRAGSSA
jgi:hypothetical protein